MSVLAQTAPTPLRRRLDGIRERGERVSLQELAQHLLVLDAPVARPIARRIVASVLGSSEADLPEVFEPHELRPTVETAVQSVSLRDADVTVVDLETTGLSARDCSILEIGAVRISKLRCTDSFETLVRPPEEVPRKIADLTGITAAVLQDAPCGSEALPAFRRWLEGTPGAPFAAHNAAFDARFVARALELYALPAYEAPVLCTQRLARRLLPELGRYNLDHVCAHFGVPNRARHRALGDARAAALVMIELFQIALETGVATTIGALLDLQSKPPRKRPRRRRSQTGRRAPMPKPRA